ncbi:glycerate kinase type-2 family protein [Terriglobus albidus]|uniref:glycerate kinase type-2 family protein n=1 Tax=Terriglobus albidus TaxID=1592106 RepID=UPI00164D4885|nr:DUF4147 domain-containing protein [Terriglobus albidus]
MDTRTVATLKEHAKQIYLRTLEAARLDTHLAEQVRWADGILQVGEHSFPLELYRRAVIIALGKAAVPMAVYSADLLRGYLPFTGLVLAPENSGAPAELTFLRGSHPFPDESSRRAAELALELAREADGETLVLWLISGGASAMMEMPLVPEISMDEMAAFHRMLVHSGLNIAEMNALRKHVSAVKGGRLAVAAANAATQVTLLVSDVPEGRPDVIASGPTIPDGSTITYCRVLLSRLKEPLPPAIAELFAGLELPETPKRNDPAFARAFYLEVLSSSTLCTEAAAIARDLGFEAVVDNGCDEWPYDKAAVYLLYKLARLRQPGKRIALISAGEVAVPVTGPAGNGGRNQHFALYAAQLIDGMANTAVLSAGSDGLDGNSLAAGAVADTATWEYAKDPAGALERFDSGTVFSLLGDAIFTGPTGNNLRDLRILLADD